MSNFLLIEDHYITSLGIGILIKRVVAEVNLYFADTYEKAVDIVRKEPIEYITLDLSIPGGIGTGMIRGLRKHRPGVKILIFSGRDELINAPTYLETGADGYLHKNSPVEETENAIAKLVRGEPYISVAAQRQIDENVANDDSLFNPIASLSPREKQVFNLILEGKWTKKIAGELDIKYSTVSTQKLSIFKKFGVDNVVDLVKKVESIRDELKIRR